MGRLRVEREGRSAEKSDFGIFVLEVRFSPEHCAMNAKILTIYIRVDISITFRV